MTTKSLLMTGALVLTSFSMGYAKSYDLVFSNAVKAGNMDLKAGEYHLKVKGNTAEFVNVDNAKTYTAPVKIVNADKKFGETAVETNQKNGATQIQKIELGGSTQQLDFGGE